MRAVVNLCLLSILSGCASQRSESVPPEIIRVPEYVPLPAVCTQIPELSIPDGTTTEDLERVLYEHVLRLRAQIRSCRLTQGVTR